MDLKFYLNKFLKVDNIEGYTYRSLIAMKSCYDSFIAKSGGHDPDFPMSNFGEDKGTRVGGVNIHRINEGEEEIIKEKVIDKATGKVLKPEPPKPVQSDYIDQRLNTTDEERALAFLKANNLR